MTAWERWMGYRSDWNSGSKGIKSHIQKVVLHFLSAGHTFQDILFQVIETADKNVYVRRARETELINGTGVTLNVRQLRPPKVSSGPMDRYLI
jgi:hypothetical protein